MAFIMKFSRAGMSLHQGHKISHSTVSESTCAKFQDALCRFGAGHLLRHGGMRGSSTNPCPNSQNSSDSHSEIAAVLYPSATPDARSSAKATSKRPRTDMHKS